MALEPCGCGGPRADGGTHRCLAEGAAPRPGGRAATVQQSQGAPHALRARLHAPCETDISQSGAVRAELTRGLAAAT